jgi:TolA-binding protein
LYTQLLAEYPEEARSVKADITAEQLRYQILGLGDKEAEISARIARASGAEKAAAMLELARMYILSGDTKVEDGYRMLASIVSSGDPATVYQARLLEGEYFYRKGDLLEASKRFLAAAVAGKSDPERAASAIYRAAEMMKMAGRPDEVKALVKRLQDSFPSSPWSAKGKSLLEASR